MLGLAHTQSHVYVPLPGPQSLAHCVETSFWLMYFYEMAKKRESNKFLIIFLQSRVWFVWAWVLLATHNVRAKKFDSFCNHLFQRPFRSLTFMELDISWVRPFLSTTFFELDLSKVQSFWNLTFQMFDYFEVKPF